ncbi:PREDICTED: histone deacetylase 15 isoform X2 [Nelumbo nucifera]|nr:PREDICTED: histone deacetylase 15 isoform X2 [Nelumbo nucifera]XP_010265271.1 PREDICTED: histone deacetylase 15 isoform X2 [Nelumbo nucifera]
MDSETEQTSYFKSGEAANGDLQRQAEQVGCEGTADCLSNGSHGNAQPEGTTTTTRDADFDADNHNGTKKRPRQRREMTLQDMYNQQADYDDDDDDDDSDWEPVQKHVVSEKWFCVNCTMVNFDDVVYCDICGEYKESGIVKHGFFAPNDAQEAAPAQVETVATSKGQESCEQKSALENFTAVGFDERMLLHSEVDMKSHPHPERPDRLRAIAASLATAGIFPGRCLSIPAREITQEELLPVHSLEHIEAVEITSCMLSSDFDISSLHLINSYFTPDTYANQHSACAARVAAGLCADLASAIMSGRTKNGFALVRPPGHHAGVGQSMGFCLHNNAAIAALAAQRSGAKKVLIVDWDVHHGNGTQEIFEGNKSVLYISLHRHEGGRFYPGTGAADEVGILGAEGYCVNVPWKCGGVGDNDYIFTFQHIVIPIALEFSPDITIISAGFDAARGDPLGCCDVTPTGYAQMTHMLSVLSGGKLLVVLEGGYNLRSISSSATAVVKVLLGESTGCELDRVVPSKAGMETVLEVLKIQKNFWPTLQASFAQLQSQWGSFPFQNRKKSTKKRRRVIGPIWWLWGGKRLMYNILYGQLRIKAKVRPRRSCC